MFLIQGHVDYDLNGDEEVTYEIVQVRKGKFKVIGYYFSNNDTIEFTESMRRIFAGVSAIFTHTSHLITLHFCSDFTRCMF